EAIDKATDYQLVANESAADKKYSVSQDGEVALTVQDSKHTDKKATVTIKDVAKKSEVDKAVKALDDSVVKYDKTGDTVNKNSITLAGGDAGTVIKNVKGGDISQNSTEAVNGGQLYKTNQGFDILVGENKASNKANISFGKDKKDTLEFAAGKNLTVSLDKDNKKVLYCLQDEVVLGEAKTADKDGVNGKLTIHGTTGEQMTFNGKNGELIITAPDEKGQSNEIFLKGHDGTIGVNGKDGNSVTLNGADGSIGMKGKDGKNAITITTGAGTVGLDGKDGETRIIVKDGDKSNALATMNDGLKFQGDDGNAVGVKLNTQVNIVGGAKIVKEGRKITNLTENNIGVESVVDATNNKNGTLKIRLAKTLRDMESIVFSGKDNTDSMTIDGANRTIKDLTTLTFLKDGKNNFITGLSNTTWPTAAQRETAFDASKAATQGQIKDVETAINDKVKKNNAGFDVYIKEKTQENTFNIALGREQKDAFGFLAGNGLDIIRRNKEIMYALQNNITLGKKDGEDGSFTVTGKTGNRITMDGKTGDLVLQGTQNATGKTPTLSLHGQTGSIRGDGKTGGAFEMDAENGVIQAVGAAGDKQVVLDGKNAAIRIQNDKNSSVTITVKDAAAGLDGKAGAARLTVTDKAGKQTVLATMSDGLKFQGDNKESTVQRALNETLTIAGGADTAKLSDKNIGVVTDATTGTMTVKLAKDIKDLTSVETKDDKGNRTVMTGVGVTVNDEKGNRTTVSAAGAVTEDKEKNTNTSTATDVTLADKDGNKTVVNKDGIRIQAAGQGTVSLTKDGLNNGGKTITGVAAGVQDTDAVNVKQLKEEIDKNRTTMQGSENVAVTGSGKQGDPFTVALKDTVTLGKKDSDGKDDGKDGKITVTGKAGNKVVIDGSAGTIEIKGANVKQAVTITTANGKVGMDNKDGTRITVQAGGTTAALATMEDGLKFQGDTKDVIVKRKLNDTLHITGGEKNADKLTEKNIGVVADSDTGSMKVQLAKNLKDMESVTFGNTAEAMKIDGTNKTITHVSTITGLTNTTLPENWDSVQPAQAVKWDSLRDDQAASQGQVKEVARKVKKVASGFDILVGEDPDEHRANVTLGGDTKDTVQFTAGNGLAATLDTQNKKITYALKNQITLGDKNEAGKLTVQEKDGSSSVIHGGTIDLTDKGKTLTIATGQGTAELGGTGKTTRLLLKDGENTAAVATMKDGLSFAGDSGDPINLQLNKQLKITGGQTDSKKLSEAPNIGVVTKDGTMTIRLSKELTGLDKVSAKTMTADTVTVGDVQIDTNGLTVKNGPAVTKNGIDAGNKPIHDLAPGMVAPNSRDAVTGAQLFRTEARVATMDNRITRTGAGAAAMAALHPLDFDPDEKWDIAAAIGRYRNAGAVALGAFYRPSESSMISVGGSFGNADPMVNVGVSLKVGRGNNITTSRVAMAKEIVTLRNENQALKNRVEMLSQKMNAVLQVVQVPARLLQPAREIFPRDVHNEWAYKYIASLAAKNYLDTMRETVRKPEMSRLEMAGLIYEALKQGAPVDSNMDRAMSEFDPELRRIRDNRIRVDRVAGNGSRDRDKIERVRVNRNGNLLG
ncbi:hemagglutinin, partial [Megasphaera lornae]